MPQAYKAADIDSIYVEENRRRNVQINTGRLIAGGLYIVGIILGIRSYTSTTHLLLTIGLLLFYLLFVIGNQISHRLNSLRGLRLEYVAIFVDYLLLFGTVFIRSYFENLDNFLPIAIKHPLLSASFVILVLPAFQYRKSMAIYCESLFLLCYLTMMTLLFTLSDYQISQRWIDHMVSEQLVLPLLFLPVFLSLVISTLIYFMIHNHVQITSLVSQIARERSVFQRYFSPRVVDHLLDTNAHVDVGVFTELTILFIDIRGFSAISEKMLPMQLIEFLSQYRKRISQAIFRYDGSIDKFIGDGIMAIFTIPFHSHSISAQERARNAIRATREIDQCMAEIDREWDIDIAYGIGVNTGMAYIGNIEGSDQVEYTAIGNTVNVASRVETLCKQLGATCVISEQTYNHVHDMVAATRHENLSLRNIKGKSNFYVLDKYLF